MIDKHEFLYTTKNFRTVVSIFIGDDTGKDLALNDGKNPVLSYAVLDFQGNPVSFYNWDGGPFEYRINNNLFSILDYQSNIVTGYTITQDLKTLYSTDEKNVYSEKIKQNIKNISNSIPVGFLFEDIEEDDMYITVSLDRSFGMLDNLTIKNNVVGDIPKRSSNTGVLPL